MRIFALLACLLLRDSVRSAAKTAERLEDAATLISEIMATPDRSIPQDLFEKAHCIVVVPGVKKAAFGFGGKYGRGFVSCRKANGPGWSAPAAVRMEGGSFGFQIGVSSTDVVLLVMNERGMEKLLTQQVHAGRRCLGGGRAGGASCQRADGRPDDG